MPTFIASRPVRKETCRVTFTNWDKTVECPPHTNLRALAIEHDIPLYNGLAKFTNCEGFGLCGTCTVEVTPQSGLSGKGARENLRFLQLKGNLRLACQVTIVDDIEVTKHTGFYGTKGYDSEAPKQEIVRLYVEEQKPVTEIAREMRLAVAKVVTILQQAGVEMRRSGSAA